MCLYISTALCSMLLILPRTKTLSSHLVGKPRRPVVAAGRGLPTGQNCGQPHSTQTAGFPVSPVSLKLYLSLRFCGACCEAPRLRGREERVVAAEPGSGETPGGRDGREEVSLGRPVLGTPGVPPRRRKWLVCTEGRALCRVSFHRCH